MDTTTWLSQHATDRTGPKSFACLEECGFCCTYPPQVNHAELNELEQATRIPTIGVDPHGNMHIPLQGDCGACTLLNDRECSAYEERPMHCRLFPFHIYLGRRVEIYTNRVCPGLDPDPEQLGDAARTATTPLKEALKQTLPAARLGELQRKHEQALATYDEFETLARDANAWTIPQQALHHARDNVQITPRAWNAALAPYNVDDDAALPTMVLPQPTFPWRAWRLENHTFTSYRFTEDGTLTPIHEIPAPNHDEPTPQACYTVLDRLITYACFLGAVYDRVDHGEYEVHLKDAALGEMNEVLAELAVRAYLLDAEGLPATPRWIAAAYEPAFYDRPTIGAWL